MASNLPYHVVDAFTTIAFSGNQAAVVLLPSSSPPPPDSYHLALAREFNFSETAFLHALPDSTALFPHYSLRWFTPVVEFPLCGHATLASAHVLFTEVEGGGEVDSATFETMSGTLGARRVAGGGIELDFPADGEVLERGVGEKERERERKVREAVETLGVEGLGEKVRGWARGRLSWIIEVDKDVPLASLKLDVRGFKDLGGYVIITQASSDPAYDILSRVLDPVEEIQEDPVTGSAHCALAPYWLGTPARARLPAKLLLPGTDSLRARQVSARGGDLDIFWDRAAGRAKLRGNAVTVMSGVIRA